jgi:hypothetical protein
MSAPSSIFGYLPDPVDERDWDSAKLLQARPMATVVESLDWRSKVVDILNQGSLGSCVAHAILGAIRLKHVFDGIKKPKLGNRLHVYAGARSYIGTRDWDSGCHIRDGFRWTNGVGFMPEDETDDGYDVSTFKELPNPREMKLMHDQRNKLEGQVEYYRVTETGAEREAALKQAMSSGGVPLLGTATTRDFLRYTDGILRKPSPTTRQTGGHAFYLCGYTPDYAIAANSWDDDWGIDGFMHLGWDYIRWRETRDIWVVDKAPYYSHLEARS